MTDRAPESPPPPSSPRGGAGRVVRLLLRDRWLVITGIATVVSLTMIYVTRERHTLAPGVVAGPAMTGLRPDAAEHEAKAASDGVEAFAWDAVAGAARYELDVFDDALNTVLSRPDLTAPRYAPTDAERTALAAGAHVWWRVVAYDDAGRRIAASTRAAIRGRAAR